MNTNNKKFFITTPIYYPSGDLHIGHAYTTTLAFVMKNYKTAMGYDAKILTGSDEHGLKIQTKAKELNISPQDYVNNMSSKFMDLWNDLNIPIDFFSRTTNDSHKKIVSQVFETLKNKNLIYKGEYKGWYSVQDEEFITESNAILKNDKLYHPISMHQLQEVAEETYFLKISEFTEWLNTYLDDHDDFIYPKKTVKELKNNFLKQGVNDLSITRTSFNWGIQVHGDEEHVIYVWLDALLNYITALDFPNGENYKLYWEDPSSEVVHLIGKEISRFHCIYWPIMLKALNIKMPNKIISHGWIVTPEGKMSKSKGNVVNPYELMEVVGTESLKYYLSTQINIGEDGIINKELVKGVYNSQLANIFGNLLSRTLAMYFQNFDSPIIYNPDSNIDLEKNIRNTIKNHLDEYNKYMDNFDVTRGLNQALLLAKELNNYIDVTKPWTLKESKKRLSIIINTLLHGNFAVWTMLKVVIPEKAKKAFLQLGVNKGESMEFICAYNPKNMDNICPLKSDPLFPRLSKL